MKNKKGNVMLVSVLFIAAILIIFVFIISIFISQVNSTLYRIKTEMYSINRNGIIAVNKNIANTGKLSYSEKEYKKYFVEAIKENYNLDENLENDSSLVEKIKIKEYEILNKKSKDSYTKKRVENVTLHTVLEIEIKPIIMKKFLDKVFIFDIHEDVVLNGVKM
ncbi:MAG: hypothetical protein J6B87_03540 [Clostridia bacterium]|nr:hypothetical protein [Clostridia bacterium]